MSTTDFNFTSDVVEAFTAGDCWHLARTLNTVAGYPIVTFQYPLFNKDLWAHAANRLPDGRIVDIEGIWEEKDWHLQWCEIMGMDPLEVYTRTWETEAWEEELLAGEFEFEYPVISENAPLHSQAIVKKLREMSA